MIPFFLVGGCEEWILQFGGVPWRERSWGARGQGRGISPFLLNCTVFHSLPRLGITYAQPKLLLPFFPPPTIGIIENLNCQKSSTG